MKGEKPCGTVTYRMHVVARDVAEMAVNAGGLMVDRMMSGWRVSVQLSHGGDVRPVQILGAELVDAVTSPDLGDEERCVLVMAADAYARAMSGDDRQLPAGWVEALVWGESPDQGHIFGHNLSAAARAFKAQAFAAAHLAVEEVAGSEAFTSMNARVSGVTLRA